MAAVQLLPATYGGVVSYLLYCIVDADRQEPEGRLRFLGYPRASIMVRAAGLGAVVSETSAADVAPDVARLLVYSKIVQSFNKECTVIPMRYGCTFRQLAEIKRLLEDHKLQYLRLLEELDGRVEMSARVTLEEAGPPTTSDAAGPLRLRARFAGAGAGSGAAYLAERCAYYALREESEKRSEELRGRICAMAEGTFVRSTSEYGMADGNRVLSVHFLVAREQVARFVEALRPLTAAAKSPLVVTGPWPPYNFVCPPTAKLPK